MLFNPSAKLVIGCCRRYRLPSNNVCSQSKSVEYYSSFDNALYGLAIVLEDPVGFKSLSKTIKEVF